MRIAGNSLRWELSTPGQPIFLPAVLLFLLIFVGGGTLSAGELTATLVNGLTGEQLAGVRITAKQRLSNGRFKWVDSETSDANGNVVFDLEGLGQGSVYLLQCKPYNGGNVYSADLTKAGHYQFRVGMTEAMVVSGVTGKPLIDFQVTAKERLADGKLRWVTRGRTDAQGIIRFDLPGLGEGHTYLLYGRSEADNSGKYSDAITETGHVIFKVGNPPLHVTLVDGVTRAPLPEVDIIGREILADGSSRWVARHHTDADGKTVFDLDGLGTGRQYQLSAKPYNGGTAYSPELNQAGDFQFRVGTLPVTLSDARSGAPIAGKRLVALRKSDEGKLEWLDSGWTDAKGTVRFDLGARQAGTVFLIGANDPFGAGKRYYSAPILAEGPVDFAISPEQYESLDRKPPVISIDTPAQHAVVAAAGFVLSGAASDNQGVMGIEISVDDVPLETVVPKNGFWRYRVPDGVVAAGNSVTISARAYDKLLNAGSASVSLNVIDDTDAPILEIVAPVTGAVVADTGFLVSGVTFDNTGQPQLNLSLPTTAGRVDGSTLEVAPDGSWTAVVHPWQLASSGWVKLTLSATDTTGNSTLQTLTLRSIPAEAGVRHLLDRITFGTTPALLAEAESMGRDAFLQRQLSPETIDNSAFVRLLGDWLPENRHELQSYLLLHMLYDRRQLQEVMAWFWENHFNTDISKTRLSWELDENRQFRQHALGRFRDLLGISAHSPAMLRYLDNSSSRKGIPNENYARELMELHTLGVDGGYTAQDIIAVARVFTGWRIRNGGFYFDQRWHDADEKMVLGEVIPADGGMDEGEQVLDMLAGHPSTANHICRKLLQLFVSDTPEQAAVQECANRFLDSRGDIRWVVEGILDSDDFYAFGVYHDKVKTPLELITGVIRNLDAAASERHTHRALNAMNMPLFNNPIPTGWAEVGSKWIDSNQLLTRVRYTTDVAFNSANERHTYLQLPELLRNAGYRTAAGVAGYLLQMTLAGDYSRLEWDTAMAILTEGGTVPFGLETDAEVDRLRRLVATLLAYPSYQLQ